MEPRARGDFPSLQGKGKECFGPHLCTGKRFREMYVIHDSVASNLLSVLDHIFVR